MSYTYFYSKKVLDIRPVSEIYSSLDRGVADYEKPERIWYQKHKTIARRAILDVVIPKGAQLLTLHHHPKSGEDINDYSRIEVLTFDRVGGPGEQDLIFSDGSSASSDVLVSTDGLDEKLRNTAKLIGKKKKEHEKKGKEFYAAIKAQMDCVEIFGVSILADPDIIECPPPAHIPTSAGPVNMSDV